MSAQTMAEAFAPVDAHYHAQVMEATWGHLSPKRNKTYRGYFVFAVGCFGDDPLNPTVLSCEFKDLDDSPWFFDSLADFIGADQFSYPSFDGERMIETPRQFPEGGVYRFDGIFRNYKFKGTFRQLNLA